LLVYIPADGTVRPLWRSPAPDRCLRRRQIKCRQLVERARLVAAGFSIETPLSDEDLQHIRAEIDEVELSAMLTSFLRDEIDLLAYTDSLDVLVASQSARVITTIETPRYITVVAPATTARVWASSSSPAYWDSRWRVPCGS
jgi:hypothetical protein